MGSEPIENTDREIWRRVPGDYYSPSIHVTADGSIGIDIGGHTSGTAAITIAPAENVVPV